MFYKTLSRITSKKEEVITSATIPVARPDTPNEEIINSWIAQAKSTLSQALSDNVENLNLLELIMEYEYIQYEGEILTTQNKPDGITLSSILESVSSNESDYRLRLFTAKPLLEELGLIKELIGKLTEKDILYYSLLVRNSLEDCGLVVHYRECFSDVDSLFTEEDAQERKEVIKEYSDIRKKVLDNLKSLIVDDINKKYPVVTTEENTDQSLNENRELNLDMLLIPLLLALAAIVVSFFLFIYLVIPTNVFILAIASIVGAYAFTSVGTYALTQSSDDKKETLSVDSSNNEESTDDVEAQATLPLSC